MFKKKTNQQPPEIKDENLTFDENGDIDSQVQAVMEKYDRESNVRNWVGIPRKVIRYLMVAFTIYCVLINFLFSWETRIERASFVGCIVFLVFLIFPARKGGGKKENYIPWYDVILALAGGFSFFYFSICEYTFFRYHLFFVVVYYFYLRIRIFFVLFFCIFNSFVP